MTGWLSRGLDALDRVLSCALGAILIIIFSLNLYQVGGRYLFGVGAVWIPDLTRLLFIWMVFLGTALMHQRKRHLVIDVLLLKFPGAARRTIEALIALGMLALAGVMAAVGWRIMQIRMDIPYTRDEINKAIIDLIKINKMDSRRTCWNRSRKGVCATCTASAGRVSGIRANTINPKIRVVNASPIKSRM